MVDFFKTRMGQKFYEADVPRIAKALEKIGRELERANELKQQELDEQRADDETVKDIAAEFITGTE